MRTRASCSDVRSARRAVRCRHAARTMGCERTRDEAGDAMRTEDVMEQVSGVPAGDANAQRADALYHEHVNARRIKSDRMFAVLMIAQWLFAIFLAAMVSPYAWSGKVREFHPHHYA